METCDISDYPSQETFCNSQTGKVLGIFPIIGKCLGQHFPLMGNDWEKFGFMFPNAGFTLGNEAKYFLKYQCWESSGFSPQNMGK